MRIRLLVRRERKHERRPAKKASAKLKGRRKVGIRANPFQQRNRIYSNWTMTRHKKKILHEPYDAETSL